MIDLEPACRATVALIPGVDDVTLADPTPCDGFTVRELWGRPPTCRRARR